MHARVSEDSDVVPRNGVVDVTIVVLDVRRVYSDVVGIIGVPEF